MEKIALAIFISALFILNTKAQISYHIYGTIDRTDVKNIFIQDNHALLDSTIVKEGTFDMHGTYESQSIVRLIFVNNNKLYQKDLILDNGDYNVTIDANLEINIVSTSINHNLFIYWFKGDERKANIKALDSLSIDYKLQIDKGNYSLSAQYLTKYHAIQLKMLNYDKKLVTDHPDCYIVPYLLKDEEMLTQENFGLTYDLLSSMVKNNLYGRLFKAALDKKLILGHDKYYYNFTFLGSLTKSFDGKLANGKIFSQSSLKGKWVLLDFWASWCGPCRAEFPFLKKTFNQFKDKNFVISSVSIDKDRIAWKKALLEENTQEFIHTMVEDFDNSEAMKHYQVYAVPTNFLINPEGRIVALNLRGEELVNALTRLIK